MKYFVTKSPEGDGRCSDRTCPCDDTIIPRGTGFMILLPEVIQWRFDCLSLADEQKKIDRIGQYMTEGLPLLRVLPIPILACEQAARAYGVDLEVARADAAHWWQTDELPLRVTPMKDGSLMRMSLSGEMALQLVQAALRVRRKVKDNKPGSYVFISYSRFDFERILEIDDWLRSAEYRTWFDVKHLDPKNIWDEEIEDAIVTAHAVLACVSTRSRAYRGYVHYEWQKAAELRGKRVIPVLLDDIALPDSLHKAEEPYRWFENDDRDRILRHLAALPPVGSSPKISKATAKVTPAEYHAFRTKLLETVRTSSALRAQGDFGRAMDLFVHYAKHPLYSLRPQIVRDIASTAAIVHAAKIEYLLAAIGSGFVLEPIVGELVRGILEAPAWSKDEVDPQFGILEANNLNRHYLHALTVIDRETSLFRTPQSLSEVAGALEQESPFVFELFRRRIADLEQLVGPHESSFANIFNIDAMLAYLPPHLIDEARSVIAEGNVFIQLPVEPNDTAATIEAWEDISKDGSLYPVCTVIPSEEAWARALFIEPALFFENESLLSEFQEWQETEGEEDDSIPWGIGESTVGAFASAYNGDEDDNDPYLKVKELFSDESPLAGLIDCLCQFISPVTPLPKSAVLLYPPFFVLVTANIGTKSDLRRAMEPLDYSRWQTLLKIQNPHLFRARNRGVRLAALVHVVLSIDGKCIDPGLAVLNLPPLGVRFKELLPSEMMDD